MRHKHLHIGMRILPRVFEGRRPLIMCERCEKDPRLTFNRDWMYDPDLILTSNMKSVIKNRYNEIRKPESWLWKDVARALLQKFRNEHQGDKTK